MRTFIVAIGLILCTAGHGFASTVFLTWTANTDTDLVGYKIYYNPSSATQPFTGAGAAEGISGSIRILKGTNSATLTGLDNSKPWYFAVTAYNTAGLECVYSNIVSIPIIPAQPTVMITSADGQTITSDSFSLAWLATDVVPVEGCKWMIGSAPDATQGNESDTSPTNVTGFVKGANLLYLGCFDPLGAFGYDSTTVNYADAPIVNGACGTANGGSFASLTAGAPNLCVGAVAAFACTGGATTPPCTWGCRGSGGGSNTSDTACTASLAASNLLFSESFEDAALASRGWYDNTGVQRSSSEHTDGAYAAQITFAAGATMPSAPYTGSMRRLFEATDSLTLTFDIKFASGWRGSQHLYHPHIFQIASDQDNYYVPPANAYLVAGVEFLSDVGSPYAIRPQLYIQDTLRVNSSLGTPPINLSAVTESRSATYCNSPLPAGATGNCYLSDAWYSYNIWKDASHSLSTGEWHQVKVWYKMNTISNGHGIADGIMREWVDGSLVIDHSDVLYRTNQAAGEKFKQLIIAPYIGDGAPIAQTFYIDRLAVYSGLPSGADTTKPYITNFNVPQTYTDLLVPISIKATDDTGTTRYCLTTVDDINTCQWSAAVGQDLTYLSYTFTAAGSYTVYGYATDLAGNLSDRASANIVITLPAAPAGNYRGDVMRCEMR